jgi:hypothetical protein
MRLTFHWTFAVFNLQKSHFTRIFFWKTGRKDKRKEKTPAYLLVHLSRLLFSILYTKSISIFKLSFHSEYKRVSKRLDAKHKPTKRTSAYLLLLHVCFFHWRLALDCIPPFLKDRMYKTNQTKNTRVPFTTSNVVFHWYSCFYFNWILTSVKTTKDEMQRETERKTSSYLFVYQPDLAFPLNTFLTHF